MNLEEALQTLGQKQAQIDHLNQKISELRTRALKSQISEYEKLNEKLQNIRKVLNSTGGYSCCLCGTDLFEKGVKPF